ncbi:MAG: tetratricopeptide repeat protein [Candidatus Binatia bacterium]
MKMKSYPTGVKSVLLAAVFLSGCLTGYLEENAARMDTQLKEQNAEIAQQRKELEALRAGRPLPDAKSQECERAFREYFDRAQLSTNRDQAIEFYRNGLGLCPDDEVARYELGRALVDAGRHGEAEREFETALRINPGFTDAKNQLDAVRNRR